jgi:hypothetical protein
VLDRSSGAGQTAVERIQQRADHMCQEIQMNRPREIEQIERALGRTFTSERLGPYSAFCSPIDLPLNEVIGTSDGKIKIEDGLKKVDGTINQLEQHCVGWNALGYTVFVGYANDFGPNTVFAIANADPIQLMDIFNVGAYNDMTGDTPDRVKRYMSQLFKTDPFVPYHVDAANFKVRFINQVSAARASEIAQAVLEFNPDAYALVDPCQLEDDSVPANEHAGPAFELQAESGADLMQRRIMQARKLELWWD